MLLLEEEWHRPLVRLSVTPSFHVLVVVQPDDAQEKSPILFFEPDVRQVVGQLAVQGSERTPNYEAL